MAARFPLKPKGMWRRTYERLHRRTFEIEMGAEEAMDLYVAKLNARIDRPNRKRSFWR